MDKQLKEKLSENRIFLVENINLNESFWNVLRKKGTVSAIDRDQIQRRSSINEQIGRLLDWLERRQDQDFDAFIKALEETNQYHIASHLLREKEAETGMVLRSQGRKKVKLTTQSSPEVSVPIPMSPKRKRLLRNPENRKKLIEKVNLDEKVWSELIEKKIIQEDEAKTIQVSNKSCKEQVGPFLDHLARRPNKEFAIFCKILEQNGQQIVVDEILKV